MANKKEGKLVSTLIATIIILLCLFIVVILQSLKINKLEKEILMQPDKLEYSCSIQYLCHIEDSIIKITKEFDDYNLFLKEEQEINSDNFYQSCSIYYSKGCWENKE